MRTIIICFAFAALLLASSCVMPDRKKQVAYNEANLAEEGYVALQVGEPRPAVSIVATDGTVICAPAQPLAGPVLLFFVTADNTPNSAQQSHKLNAAAADLAAAGVTAAVVLAEQETAAQGFQAKHCPDLLLVADADRAVATAYGCATEGAQFLQRTQVGIGADGKIAFYERGFPLTTAALLLERFGLAPAKK